MTKRDISFEQLIDPKTPQEFFAEYWERNFLYLPCKGKDSFKDLFSLHDVDAWLMSTRSGEPDSVMITAPEGADGSKPGGAMRRYRPRDIAIEEVYNAFAQGCSVVLNRLEDSWAPVSRLVKVLGAAFCAKVGVNVYLTPRGTRTFPIHLDNHDVFVLQVNGEKTWRLHETRRLPIMQLDYKKDIEVPPDWGKGDLDAPLIAELRLRPGDVLYVPRGMPHCAVTTDTASLHLTISITPLYWIDFLKIAVEQTSLRVPLLRKAVPPGFVGDRSVVESMLRDFTAALQEFEDNVVFEEVLAAAKRNRIQNQGYPLDGHFRSLANLEEDLRLDLEVERREGILLTLECSEEFSLIRFATRQVRGPRNLRRALEFICDNRRFTVRDLPGLDDKGKLVLVRRLIREGLLRIPEVPERPARLVAVVKSA